ncbi:hypothetical protein BBD40_06285 [Paenibacillus ihbetae]|uniref:Aminoglycoside phosphotransferase domain-containing protein n=1 Tax=Paenibacillus ihbetae TaxID=1870820 RepID=A0ABX3JXK1_9BACL|nr:hypothetical protein [Paenibacillus ihbetae]OOC61514.1 hypothetical protein BBD40_06285 [Paenibacillus ihbetae]
MEPRQIEILCNELGLGDIVVAPALSGGLLHRKYAVQTTSGKTMFMQTERARNYKNAQGVCGGV